MLASGEITTLLEDLGVDVPEGSALLEVRLADVRLEDLEAMVARLRRMTDDPVVKALPRIREMGHEEIAKTHAARQPAHVSDGRSGIIRLEPDGTRHVLQSDDIPDQKS